MSAKKQRVIFICTHNSARSQMAEGLMRHYLGDKYEVYSAGTQPSRVHPLAIEVMKELNIDISGHRSKSADEFKDQYFDYVITVCDSARETCPYFPNGQKQLHQSFVDPAAVEGSEQQQLEAFRKVRDEIKQWILNNFS